ncbi:hypothetical protein ACWN8M_00020 [Pseudolactococcus reticulitermitis]
MTPLGRSVSAGQVSRFYEVKSQKAFERTKFASDPAWTERERRSSFKIPQSEIAERGNCEKHIRYD